MLRGCGTQRKEKKAQKNDLMNLLQIWQMPILQVSALIQ